MEWGQWQNKFISAHSPGKSFSSILLTIIKYLESWKEKEMRRKRDIGKGIMSYLKHVFVL